MVNVTLEEVRRMAAQIDVRSLLGLRDKAILALAMHTALRVSEIAGLSVHDVAHNGVPRATMFVRSAIAKGGHSRAVPMNAIARHVVAVVLHFNQTRGFDTSPEAPLFQNRFHQRISVRAIQRMVEELRNQAGLDVPATPHSLRHHAASRLAETSNLRIVQKVLGHRRITSTEIYTHPSLDELRQATDRLVP